MCFSKPGLAVSAEAAPGNLPECPRRLLCPFSLFSVSLCKNHTDRCTGQPRVARQSDRQCGGRAWRAGGPGARKGPALANQVKPSFVIFLNKGLDSSTHSSASSHFLLTTYYFFTYVYVCMSLCVPYTGSCPQRLTSRCRIP